MSALMEDNLPPEEESKDSEFKRLSAELLATPISDPEPDEDAPAVSARIQDMQSTPISDEPDLKPAVSLESAAPKPDTELADAQRHARNARLRANLGRAGTTLTASVGGDPDMKFWDGIEAQGKTGIADLKERRAADAAQAKATRAAARLDKNSPESIAARNAVIPILGDKYVKLLKDKGVYDSITADDIDNGKVFNSLKLRAELDSREAEAETKKKSKEGDAAALANMQDLLLKNYPKELAARKYDEAGVRSLDAATIKELKQEIQSKRNVDTGFVKLNDSQAETEKLVAAARTEAARIEAERVARQDEKEKVAQLEDFGKAINRDAGRGSLIPQAQNRLNASERIKAAATNPDGSIKDLSPAMITEIATSTAALLSNGTPGEHAISAMLPKGRGMKAAEIEEWFSNNPHGAGQQEYIKMLVGLANREEHVIGEQIRAAQLRQLSRFGPGFKKYGSDFWNTARSQIGDDVQSLVDPETLVPVKAKGHGAKAPAPVPAGKVRVKRTADGVTGTLDANDPKLKSGEYELVKP